MSCKLRPLLVASNIKAHKINWFPSVKFVCSSELQTKFFSTNTGSDKYKFDCGNLPLPVEMPPIVCWYCSLRKRFMSSGISTSSLSSIIWCVVSSSAADSIAVLSPTAMWFAKSVLSYNTCFGNINLFSWGHKYPCFRF